MRIRLLLVPLLVLIFCRTASAHPGHAENYLGSGFAHPFSGFDHVLAMAAVGLLAVRMGGRALWAMPATFVGSMTLGWVAGAVGLPLPGVEYGVMASVLALGLMLGMARTARLWTAVPLIALFAWFHGHAHAAEMVAGGSPSSYAAGFILATILLHAAGVVGGLLIVRSAPGAMRVAGAGICAAGLLMLCGLI